MTIQPKAPFPVVIPETAPFTPEQRSWLNGFVAGLVSLDAPQMVSLPDQAAPAASTAGGAALASNDDAPWHDPSMPLDDRMKLADGKPIAPRLMAAMAQQDCGQCGYNCAEYANALVLKSEERLNLCVPGGKETARMLKTLAEEIGASKAEAKPAERPHPRCLGKRGAAVKILQRPVSCCGRS